MALRVLAVRFTKETKEFCSFYTTETYDYIEVSTDMRRMFIIQEGLCYHVISSRDVHVLLEMRDVYFHCGATQLSNSVHESID
jgi:hypothetical protein